jgi:hypothetical protein
MATTNPTGDTSIRKRAERRKEQLKPLRQPYEAQWTELAENVAPKRLRLTLDKGQGEKARSKIVDSTGTFALRTLASGMHSGITSPARPWFKLMTYDPELREFGPVRTYIDAVEKRMREIFQGSNLYKSFHYGYGDLGLFGQSCGLLVEDRQSIMRMIQLQHGSFWLARDERGIADTLCREFSWSVERIVARFATGGRGESADLSRISRSVRQCYDRGDYDQRFTINHLIQPRHERSPGKIDKANKPWASVYWEEGGRGPNDEKDQMLEVSGFDENPIIAPPWELPAEDHYAISPGEEALPDVKMLQTEQTDKAQAIQKMHKPPMKGPTSMKGNPASLLPGSITYVDDPSGQGYTPAMQVNLRVGELQQDIQQVQGRIERAFYADLFLMLANMEGIQPRNNFEIAERKEEKLLALGPVLENIYGNQLAPTIARTYAIMERAGQLPPAPKELEGEDLKIEYISMLAQAQKAVATGGIERLFSFVGNLSAVNPNVLDKIDMDEGIDQYADMLGTPAGLVVADDEVQKVRAARAEQQAAQAQAESTAAMMPAVKQGADAAKVLAETDAGTPGSLLAKLGIG